MPEQKFGLREAASGITATEVHEDTNTAKLFFQGTIHQCATHLQVMELPDAELDVSFEQFEEKYLLGAA